MCAELAPAAAGTEPLLSLQHEVAGLLRAVRRQPLPHNIQPFAVEAVPVYDRPGVVPRAYSLRPPHTGV